MELLEGRTTTGHSVTLNGTDLERRKGKAMLRRLGEGRVRVGASVEGKGLIRASNITVLSLLEKSIRKGSVPLFKVQTGGKVRPLFYTLPPTELKS